MVVGGSHGSSSDGGQAGQGNWSGRSQVDLEAGLMEVRLTEVGQ